ncbi:RNA polymerase sigma factor [Sorangium sp. So ce1335]|uniref:RNA polymerase sigma factor n=1 Tax=Sorangium sp. So ce1335 TaxID=3133335 RepID=UPI003F644E18
MAERDPLVSELHQGRERFLALVADVRPDLHRYCARMTGSVADGEDIVQETLARAYYALSELDSLPPLRPWLFGIAHRRAIDHLRRYDRRMGRPLEVVLDTATAGGLDAEDTLAQEEAVRAALSRFVALAPMQRSCVILKDVLGHALDEIAELLEMSVPAVKAALHRGRAQLRKEREDDVPASEAAPRDVSPDIARYATLFNARDWDGVRAMLAEDVRLDLVSRSRRAGRRAVGGYVTNYASKHDWHMVPAWLEGREVLAVFRGAGDERPGYFIELSVADGRVTSIRDFRYVPYIARDATFTIASAAPPPRHR